MGRPTGSELITTADLREAAERIRGRIGPRGDLSQVALATEAGISETGLRTWHRRRGLTWPAFRDSLDSLPVACRCEGIPSAHDSSMRALLVPVSPEVADLLRELARADKRHPRAEAEILLAEAVRRHRPRVPRPRALEPVA